MGVVSVQVEDIVRDSTLEPQHVHHAQPVLILLAWVVTRNMTATVTLIHANARIIITTKIQTV